MDLESGTLVPTIMDGTIDKKTAIGLCAGVGCGLLAGWLLRGRGVKTRAKIAIAPKNGLQNGFKTTGECKMVLVVRTDLDMTSGKISAQSAHAAVKIFSELRSDHPELLATWMSQGMPKVVLKTDSEKSLLGLYDKACSLGLPATVISDAGRTQIEAGSKTVLGVGPGPAELVDKVTGSLKLF